MKYKQRRTRRTLATKLDETYGEEENTHTLG